MNEIKSTKISLSRHEANLARQECFISLCRLMDSSLKYQLCPLSETKQSQVYLVRKEGPLFVLKRHLDEFAYARELLAHTMFQKAAVAPDIITWSDDDRIIVTEYLEEEFHVAGLEELAAVARCLGVAHGFASLCQRRGKSMTAPRCPDILTIVQELSKKNSELSALVSEIYKVFGGEYYPLSIGDIKKEHLRAKQGACKLIDFETFRWGGLEVLDIYKVVCLWPLGCSFDIRANWVAESYCESRGQLNEIWSASGARLISWLYEIKNIHCR